MDQESHEAVVYRLLNPSLSAVILSTLDDRAKNIALEIEEAKGELSRLEVNAAEQVVSDAKVDQADFYWSMLISTEQNFMWEVEGYVSHTQILVGNFRRQRVKPARPDRTPFSRNSVAPCQRVASCT